jgi:acyl-CoA thioester hydrolase
VTLPYPLPELDLSAPFDRYRSRVLPAWIDANAHMNMAYYMVVFDHASELLLAQAGLSSECYTQNALGMLFVVEAHIEYQRELAENAPIAVSSQIIDLDRKLLHLFMRMRHATEGYAAASCQLLFLHADFKTRRSASWPNVCMERLEALAVAHRALPPPDRSKCRMGIDRSRHAARS